MSRTILIRISLVLVLGAVLSLAPQSSWAGTARHPHSPTATPPAHPAADLVAQAWNHLVSVWARVGSIIDPNGLWSPIGTSNGSSATDPRTVS
ncbi:MAG TPA: hypothetical protein VFE33_11715 [Thermoanaerobaculia bacterium]|nr:hypothetical protein [Thermoanaerobaculia bacterium]